MSGRVEATRPLGPKDGTLALMVVSAKQVQWVPLAAARSLVIGRTPECDVFVDDGSLSRRHASVRLTEVGVEVEDLGSSNGTVLSGQRLDAGDPRPLPLDAVIELGSTVVMLRRLSAVPEDAVGPFGRVRLRIARLAKGTPSLLLLGEGGVGKRTLARQVLAEAPADELPLREIECGQLQAGALTTWPTRGACVLLRVSETPRAIQPGLAEALSNHRGRLVVTSRIDPGTLARSRQLDPRLIRALPSLVVVVPSLRDCGPEVATIATELLAELSAEVLSGLPQAAEHRALRLSKAARADLLQRAWPGNVGELRRVLKAAAAVAEGPEIELSHLDANYEALSADDRERLRILAALRDCAGNQTSAAKRLGLSRRALVYRLDKYGIDRPRKPTGA